MGEKIAFKDWKLETQLNQNIKKLKDTSLAGKCRGICPG